jgi:hypothetical protein
VSGLLLSRNQEKLIAGFSPHGSHGETRSGIASIPFGMAYPSTACEVLVVGESISNAAILTRLAWAAFVAAA